MAPQQQWRAKVVSEACKETRVEAAEGRGVIDVEVPVETEVNQFDRPATLVGPVNKESAQDRSDRPNTPVGGVSAQAGAEFPTPSQNCPEVTTPTDDEKDLLDDEPSPVAEMSFSPHDDVFQRLKDSENHLKPLYIQGHLDGTPIS
jgi:hypothetical protein